MSRVLVAYASKHGSTAEIAKAIAEQLRDCGHTADCQAADEVKGLEPYDAVVVGSAVYMKRWRREAHRLLKHERRALSERPFWIFSSGPCGEKRDPSWVEPADVVKRAERLGARDHVVFGGRLPIEPGNFVERAMVEGCPPEHRDLRDWEAIRGWAATIAAELAAEQAIPTAPSVS
jgi:menaquinone-dependent protoporphyrinogen oxidase